MSDHEMLSSGDGGGLTFTRKSDKRRKWIFIAVAVIAVIVAFLIGYLVRRAVGSKDCEDEDRSSMGMSVADRAKLYDEIVKELNAEKIKENLRYFSKEPHVAGLKRNNELGIEIHRRFQEYGFKAEYSNYNVLLSYPKKDKPNIATIEDSTGKATYTTHILESFLEPNEKTTEAVQPFNAYSPAGIAEGDLVYVNYGTYEDFQILKNHYGINCTGKVVIARYGAIFRGDKVDNAQSNGAIGILIYNDPINYGPAGDNELFPNSWWMPRDGVQRGSIGKGDGDPLTPGYASADYAFRLTEEEARRCKYIPAIPCHPISAEDAFHFMSKLDGTPALSNWTGGYNFTYKVGPGFSAPHTDMKVKISVYNEMKQVQISNVIGTIPGAVEPDRYVLVGNHRDAWVFGAADASSGTAVMMEMARVLGEKMKSGWRPRRTIMFCSWDGEEHGIIGSQEWVEEREKLLASRAVAYVNIDTAVFGNYSMRSSSSPLLYDLIYETMKEVPDATDPSMTAYERYTEAFPKKTDKTMPQIGNLGSGSDYLAFYQLAGIPSVDLTHTMRQVNRKYNTSFYPVYHSLHDTFYWMTNFVDKDFSAHLTVARVAQRITLNLADMALIKMNVKNYPAVMESAIEPLNNALAKANANAQGISTDHIKGAVQNLTSACAKFSDMLKKVDMNDVMQVRMMNDRLIQFEHNFILPYGLPGRPSIKHTVFAPSLHNNYGSTLYPAIIDGLYDIEKTNNWNEVKEQLTYIALFADAAAKTLDTV